MTKRTADVVICGAGIAGISAAHALVTRFGVTNVVLVDDRAPLSLTSDKSSEDYRNWWPGPDAAMIRLMNRSIDLLEELSSSCGDRFLLNRRGYLFATTDANRAETWIESGRLAQAQGAGALRIHRGTGADEPYETHRPTGWAEAPTGGDLILDRARIRALFPYLDNDVCGVLHARRCGWFSGQQLGMEQLERARRAGAELISGRVVGVLVDHGRVSGVRVASRGEESIIHTPVFVNAAGPMLRPVARLLGIDLPVYSELHLKTSFKDHLGAVPRDAPLVVLDDPQRLRWSPEEAEALDSSDETRWLLSAMPAGVHMRPEGREHVIILWPYHCAPVEEEFPIRPPPNFSEVALRGMARLIPSLTRYLDRLPATYEDGGYYTRTRDNRPLACPLPVDGAFVHGALSGFGLMASMGTAELLGCHVSGSCPPDNASSFDLKRYEDPAYLAAIDQWSDDGQL